MTTYVELVNEIHDLLHSYCGSQEQVTYLTSGIDSDDLTLPVADASAFSQGLVEIGDELLQTSTATNSTEITVFPFGRGARGTTAAAHSANVMVTFNPLFPRSSIKREVSRCVEQLFPQLYAVDSTTFTFDGAQTTYDLPAGVEQVLKVTWETVGPSLYWQTVGAWEFAQDSETGPTLTFHEYVYPGRTVRVEYTKKPAGFSSDSDTFAVAGLQESWRNLIVYCVTSKLIRFLEPARLQTGTVENLSRASVVAAGDAGKIANQLYAMYQQELAYERRKLLDLNPPSIHFTR